MKVLHINCNYIATTLHQLMVERLDKKQIESKVFVPTYNKNLAVITPDSNVTVSECFKKWDRLFFDYKQSKIIKAARKNFNIGDFDIIHAYTLFTDGNCARNLSKKSGVPYVVAIRNTDINAFLKKMPHLRPRAVKILLDAKAVFFLSVAYRNELLEKYVPKKFHQEIMAKSYIIPNGIDDFWFENTPSEKKQPERAVRFIYAGRVEKNKNIGTTQKAMTLLKEKGIDVSLTVVGSIKSEEEFEKISKNEATTYIPAKPKEELIEFYRDADIFVMPSFHESFGLVYAEAMSQGLPVIYSCGQGFDGQFGEGEVGFRVNSSSPEEIAEKTTEILKNYCEISKNCIEKCKKFNWDDICEQYDKIYSSIL